MYSNHSRADAKFGLETAGAALRSCWAERVVAGLAVELVRPGEDVRLVDGFRPVLGRHILYRHRDGSFAGAEGIHHGASDLVREPRLVVVRAPCVEFYDDVRHRRAPG